MSFAQMSLTGSVFIVFILVLRALTVHRLPKATFFILWGVAALRLLLPFSISSPFSIYTYAEQLLAPVKQTVSPIIFSQQSHSASSVLADTPISSSLAGLSIMTMVWLVGVGLMAFYFVRIYLKNIRKFRLSIPSDIEFIKEWLANHQTIRPIQVKVSDCILSPLTYGFFRPVILLPKNIDDENTSLLTYTLTHEYVHIRRFDMASKMMFAAVLCVHWFNPLVWVMYILANRDMELSCDERVIQTLGEKKKAAYALALLDMEEIKSGTSSLCSHFSSCAMEERTLSIMKYKKCSPLMAILAVMLILGATLCLAMSPPTSSDFSNATTAQTLGGALDDVYTLNGLEDWLDVLQTEANALVERGELTQQQASDFLLFYQNQVANLLSASAADDEIMIDQANGSSQQISYSLDELYYIPPDVDSSIASLLDGGAYPDIAVILPQGQNLLSFDGDF